MQRADHSHHPIPTAPSAGNRTLAGDPARPGSRLDVARPRGFSDGLIDVSSPHCPFPGGSDARCACSPRDFRRRHRAGHDVRASGAGGRCRAGVGGRRLAQHQRRGIRPAAPRLRRGDRQPERARRDPIGAARRDRGQLRGMGGRRRAEDRGRLDFDRRGGRRPQVRRRAHRRAAILCRAHGDRIGDRLLHGPARPKAASSPTATSSTCPATEPATRADP